MNQFIKDRIKISYGNQGMTLIEVLIVVVLLAVVLAPAVNAISATNNIWSHNDAINPRIAQANTSMVWISREIREAAQPSKAVNSVIVEDNGQRLIIYRYNETSSEWEKIIYQVDANKLNKIISSDADPAAVIAITLPGDDDPGWTTLLNGVTSNPVFIRPESSRAVEVNLQVSDIEGNSPRFAPFNVASTYMIRSREVGAITGEPVPDETEPPVIATVKVDVNPSSTKFVIMDSTQWEETLHATIWPANATNKSVTWSSSDTAWVTVEYDPANSLTAKIVLMKKRSDYNDWDWLLLVPPWVTVTATPNGGETIDTCTVNINKIW